MKNQHLIKTKQDTEETTIDTEGLQDVLKRKLRRIEGKSTELVQSIAGHGELCGLALILWMLKPLDQQEKVCYQIMKQQKTPRSFPVLGINQRIHG